MRIATIEIIVPTTEQADSYSADQLVLLHAHYGLIAERIAEEGYDIPRDLSSALKVLKRELDHKLAVDRERQLQNLLSRRASLATVAEKREQLDAEIAELQGKVNPLAKAAPATAKTE